MIITRVAYALFMALWLAAVAGCNTIEGMGEDTAAAGEAVDDSAEDAKTY